MTPDQFLSRLDSTTRDHLTAIHKIIVGHDVKTDASVERMMGKEMIVYKEKGIFKYALASMKNYMTIHAMPLYASPLLRERYAGKLPKVTFQKGCINFVGPDDMPLIVVDELIKDCAAFDYGAVIEMHKKRKPQRRGKKAKTKKS